jgi:hypothetical protein
MWRSVYRKAADAAEARLQALLAEHQYHLHGRRAIVFVVDGAGAELVPGEGCDVELPWAYVLEGWALYADAVGSATVDLQAATFADFPTFSSLCAGAPPALVAEDKAQGGAGDLTGWTTALPRGTVLRPVLEAAGGVTRVSLTLWVRAV